MLKKFIEHVETLLHNEEMRSLRAQVYPRGGHTAKHSDESRTKKKKKRVKFCVSLHCF